MPWKHDSAIAALRVAYNVTVTAHADCARALTGALMRGDAGTKMLVEAEVTARRQKEEARRKLHAAMARDLGPLPPAPGPTKSR